VIGIAAGFSAAELIAILQEKNLHLPLNFFYATSTIGSAVACNDVGPDMMFGGGLRDSIIGMSYLNARGNAVHSGGKVVKNVSGYDLSKLMLGSRGGMGVILSINFKVLPKPINPHIAEIPFTDLSWRTKGLCLLKAKIPMDWSFLTYADSVWQWALGYSGNSQRLIRIEQELLQVFGPTASFFEESDATLSKTALLGKMRYRGFIGNFQESFAIHGDCLHLIAHSSPKSILQTFPFAKLMNDGWKLMVCPESGKCHLFSHQTSAWESALNCQLANFGAVEVDQGLSASEPRKLNTIRHIPNFEVQKSLKRFLDPQGLFFSPYYTG
jgi:hypothetical protein